MKKAIDTFVELGRCLRSMADESRGSAAIELACRENEWFTPAEIAHAAKALADVMLNREALEEWLADYPTLPAQQPKSVLVIMAGNIPMVGFFDLLCVVMSGHRCLVKPASKDAALMRYVVEELLAINPDLPVEIYTGAQAISAVIATGSDNANRYFRTQYAHVPTLLRGSRQSVAVLSGAETDAQLSRLAADIWTYSGLGCRNVSLVFLPRGAQLRLPQVAVSAKYRNNYLQQRALLTLLQRKFTDLGNAVAVEQAAFPAAISEISYIYYDSLSEVEAWISGHEQELQCVVGECKMHREWIPFGNAQSPLLTDYPDRCDSMAWLSKL